VKAICFPFILPPSSFCLALTPSLTVGLLPLKTFAVDSGKIEVEMTESIDRQESAFDFGGGARPRAEGTATLATVVETVRRILRADTASIASFSLEERTVTWLATSGFQSAGAAQKPSVMHPR
jgi:hypothetical protein